MNILLWIFYLFYPEPYDDELPTREMHGTQSGECGQISAKSEMINSISVKPKYKTVEKINPQCGLVFQQIKLDDHIHSFEKKDVEFENRKFKELLEKIHKYDILGDAEYTYIQNLPREKIEYLIYRSSK